MKKFWVFVIICVVCLGIGFTAFRFMSKDEVLYVKQTVFEVNSGDNFVLDIVQENLKPGTEINVQVENSNILQRTGETDKYNFKALAGGTTTILVSSTLKNFTPIRVQVTVGDGNYATPFLIKNQEQLASIGVTRDGAESPKFPLTSCYKLTANLVLSGDWTPIGASNDAGFVGKFDFNGKKIQNLSITTTTGTNAGLFAKLGEGAVITNPLILDVSISAGATNVGALAGQNKGSIENAVLNNISISNDVSNAVVGGLVGLNNGTVSKCQIFGSNIVATGANSTVGGLVGASELSSISTTASVSRSSAECNVQGTKYVGGLVGAVSGSIIENCYAGSLDTDCVITSGGTAYAGGVVGLVQAKTIDGSSPRRSYVADTYSVMKFKTANKDTNGAVVGLNNNYDASTNCNIVYGNYFSNDITPTVSGIASSQNEVALDDYKGVYQKTADELKRQSTYFSYTAENGTAKSWQFAEGVWGINEGLSMPQLTFAVSYVSSRVQNFTSPTQITTANFVDKLSGEIDSSTVYTLSENITLTSANGYVPFNFNGQLTCPLDEQGNPLYSITLVLNSESSVSDGIVALFKELGKDAKLSNINIYTTISNITTANKIASFAGVNNGIIENCKTLSNDSTIISNDGTSGKIYIAGIVAENRGKVSDCVSNVAISCAKSPTQLYVGGISAYSTNTIQNSTNNGKLTITGKTEAYIGGVAGYSNADITKCANHGEIVGEKEASDAYYAGVVAMLAQNVNAKLTYSSSYGTIEGSNVGGVVAISAGAIEYCYSSATCTGRYVGGLVYNIKQGTNGAPSYIKNSMTDGNSLYGDGETSVVCGAVYQMDVSADHLAYASNIFTSVYILGNGAKYYESASNIRGDSSNIWHLVSAIDSDAFNNSIHVQRDSSINRSRFDSGPAYWGIKGGKEDIEISEEVATGQKDGYAIFKSNNYSSNVWLYNETTIGNYITLRGIAK